MSLTNKEKKKIDNYLSRENCSNLLKWKWCQKSECSTCDQYTANDIANIVPLMKERDDWDDFFTYLLYHKITAGMSFSDLIAWLYVSENFFKVIVEWIDWNKEREKDNEKN